MKLNRDTVRTLLALELNKVGCTLLDAEEFFKEAAMSKSASPMADFGGAAKGLANAAGWTAAGVGAAGGITGYSMYSSMKDSEKEHKKRLAEIQQYQQAIKDLEAAKRYQSF